MKKFIINACIVFLGILFAVLVVADIGLVGAAIEHREYTYLIAVAVSIVINVLIWTAVTRLFKKNVQIRRLEEEFENEFKLQQSQKSISSQDDAKCLSYAASPVDTTPMKHQRRRENRAAADRLQHMMSNEEFIHYTELKLAHNELYIQALKYVDRDTDTAAAPISADKLASHSDACAIAVYANGRMIRTIPPVQGDDYYKERQVFYNARYIISDNILYDLYDAETNKTMHIPQFEKTVGMLGDVTSDIVYVLRKKAAMMFDDRATINAAVELIKRTAEMMPACNFSFSYEDYMRTPALLYRYGFFDEADKELSVCDALFGQDKSLSQNDNTKPYCVIENSNNKVFYNDKSDLLVTSYTRCCCEECAKYRERVFSYYGRDSRFPMLPDKLKTHEYFFEHKGCDLSFFPFNIKFSGFTDRNGTTLFAEDTDKIISIANRPFHDDRTAEEIEIYENHKSKLSNGYDFSLDKKLGISYLEYRMLVDRLPELAPKSITGYRRMKTMQSAGYMRIKKAAAEAGLILSD